MAVVALVLIPVWWGLVAIVPTVRHANRGGGPVNRGTDRPGTPQWWSRVLGGVGMLFAVAAPVFELLGMQAIPVLDHLAVRLTGLVLMVAGIGAILIAQAAMGASWRADVDPDMSTDLVTTGPFRWVRNPIFTSTAITFVGLALMVPNALAVVMVLVSLASLQLQVRLVEEPHLRRTHGDAYARYAARTGRFVSGLGRCGRARTEGGTTDRRACLPPRSPSTQTWWSRSCRRSTPTSPS